MYAQKIGEIVGDTDLQIQGVKRPKSKFGDRQLDPNVKKSHYESLRNNGSLENLSWFFSIRIIRELWNELVVERSDYRDPLA